MTFEDGGKRWAGKQANVDTSCCLPVGDREVTDDDGTDAIIDPLLLEFRVPFPLRAYQTLQCNMISRRNPLRSAPREGTLP